MASLVQDNHVDWMLKEMGFGEYKTVKPPMEAAAKVIAGVRLGPVACRPPILHIRTDNKG